jgi:hypothetical protein
LDQEPPWKPDGASIGTSWEGSTAQNNPQQHDVTLFLLLSPKTAPGVALGPESEPIPSQNQDKLLLIPKTHRTCGQWLCSRWPLSSKTHTVASQNGILDQLLGPQGLSAPHPIPFLLLHPTLPAFPGFSQTLSFRGPPRILLHRRHYWNNRGYVHGSLPPTLGTGASSPLQTCCFILPISR